jgi:hypothetical protein
MHCCSQRSSKWLGPTVSPTSVPSPAFNGLQLARRYLSSTALLLEAQKSLAKQARKTLIRTGCLIACPWASDLKDLATARSGGEAAAEWLFDHSGGSFDGP